MVEIVHTIEQRVLGNHFKIPLINAQNYFVFPESQ